MLINLPFGLFSVHVLNQKCGQLSDIREGNPNVKGVTSFFLERSYSILQLIFRRNSCNKAPCNWEDLICTPDLKILTTKLKALPKR